MSRQQDLQDMRDLLQQMREMEGYAVPEHCDGWSYQEAKQSAAKRFRHKTDEVKLEEYFNDLSDDDARKAALSGLMDITQNPKDIFNVLAKHIVDPDALLKIVHSNGIHNDELRREKKVENAFKTFKDSDPKHQKVNLKLILAQLWSEGITPLAVFKELVKQMMIRNEMKAWLKPVP